MRNQYIDNIGMLLALNNRWNGMFWKKRDFSAFLPKILYIVMFIFFPLLIIVLFKFIIPSKSHAFEKLTGAFGKNFGSRLLFGLEYVSGHYGLSLDKFIFLLIIFL